MNNKNYNEEVNTIKYLATKNGYNIKLIDNMIKKIKNKNVRNTNNKEVEDNDNKYVCLPFNTTFNKAIRKTFQNSKFKISYKTRHNSFNLINKHSRKDQPQNNIYNKSGIYKLKCSDCDSFYIGQSGRNFETRYKEHLQAFKSKNKTSMKSNFAEHLIHTNHTCKNMEENMEVIDFERKGEKMNTKEQLHLYLHYKDTPQHLLNTHTHYNNPLFEKIRHLKKPK